MPSGLKLWGIMTASAIVLSDDSPTLVKAAARLAKVVFHNRIQICDGVNDQVEIQAANDALPASGGLVKLLEGQYSISDTISVKDWTQLDARGAHITLTTDTYVPMLNNSDPAGGNTGIRIVGGIWDGNAPNQAAPPYPAPGAGVILEATNYGIRLDNCTDFQILDLTTKDIAKFSIFLTNCDNFLVSNIFFNTETPAGANQDGIKVMDCSFGTLRDLRGMTPDDFISISTNTGNCHDIVVDGVNADGGYACILLMIGDFISVTADTELYNIDISNVILKNNTSLGFITAYSSGGVWTARQLHDVNISNFIGDGLTSNDANLWAIFGNYSEGYAKARINLNNVHLSCTHDTERKGINAAEIYGLNMNNVTLTGFDKGLYYYKGLSLKITNFYFEGAGAGVSTYGISGTGWGTHNVVLSNFYISEVATGIDFSYCAFSGCVNGLIHNVTSGIVDNMSLVMYQAGNYFGNIHFRSVPTKFTLVGASLIKNYNHYCDTFRDVLAASANLIVNAQNFVNGAIALTGVQPKYPRGLVFAITAGVTEYTLTVVGTNGKGETITEIFTFADDGLAFSSDNAFDHVTSITLADRAGAAATIDIGIDERLGLMNVIYETGDIWKITKNTVKQVVAGAQVDVDYDTYDMSVIGLALNDDFEIWYKSNLNIAA